jgi:hypothetical protein
MSVMRPVLLSALLICCVTATTAVAQQPKKPAPKAPAKPAPAKPAAPAPAAAKPPAPPPPPSDIVVKTQYVAGDKTTATTVSAKGKRERVDYGSEMSVITQCDAGQLVQIADQTKRYLVAPLEPPAEASAKAKKGGVVTFSTVVTDTGEKKTMLGQPARRLNIVMTKESSADACDKKKQRVETDGWFVERPAVFACSAGDRRSAYAVTNNCRDDLKYVDPPSPIGYPLAYTAVTTGDDNKPSTMTMEVTGFDRQNLADSLFAVPDGYSQAKTLAELTAASKRTGVTRVGVVAVGSKVKDELSLQLLSEALVESLTAASIDAVALEASSAASAIDEARNKACDYVLVTDITDVRKPSRGIVGRVSGARDFGAKVDYLLLAPGSTAPMMSGSERSGTSNLQVAVKTAQLAYRYATPMGLLSSRFNFMQTYMAMAGGQNGSMPAQSPDPVMNTLFSVLNSATGADKPQVPLESADAAVAAAMEKQVAAIAAKLVKP